MAPPTAPSAPQPLATLFRTSSAAKQTSTPTGASSAGSTPAAAPKVAEKAAVKASTKAADAKARARPAQKVKAKPRVQTMNNTLSFNSEGWGIGPAVVEPKGKLNLKAAAVKGIDESLPPIIALDDIFSDLVGKVDLSATLDALNGRKLRVGTMCSGTESPLLALGIVSNIIGNVKTDQKLEIEHIFSAEIESYKQAYIERNFSPPILFRDVTELGGDKAHTAYGGLVTVPGNIDILVAGTSCVDYSPLNRHGKGLDDGGESGDTFAGMLAYVVKHRPVIVILENVCKAPWKDVEARFSAVDYDALALRLDTKDYYIPHTRTRGYLIAIRRADRKKPTKLPQAWKLEMTRLKRPASVSLEAFLLPSDDPRVARARLSKSTGKLTKGGDKRAPPPWALCETRHYRSRDEEDLGPQRVLTRWKDGGGAPDPIEGLWKTWLGVQVERVCDSLDINSLRLAKEMVDAQYKSLVWDLSQNVDRGGGSKVYGITPCLTPNMIAFLAIRGGPVIGIEALSLQGIPVDQLLLTRETEQNLADLAGNAMSSTVVGTAILAALSVAGGLIDRIDADVSMADASSLASQASATASKIVGEELLTDHAVDLSSFEPLTPAFLELANQSARRCECEGRRKTSDVAIYACKACGRSVCADCRTRPAHRDEVDARPRVHPDVFEAEAKRVLPMRFTLDGFGKDQLEQRIATLEKDGVNVETALRVSYLNGVSSAVQGHEFHFRGLTRRATWVASYSNEFATVELLLDPNGVTWQLTVQADRSLPAKHSFRIFLREPVARLTLDRSATSFLDGTWRIRVPLAKAGKASGVTAHVDHIGKDVQSWRSSLGLVNFADETRASQLKVTASPEALKLLDRPIDGVYVLEDQCGTATNSLYRRVDDDSARPLYLFLDPTRSEQSNHDSYSFAESCCKLEYGSFRPAIARLPVAWWPATRAKATPETLDLAIGSTWIHLDDATLTRGSADASSSIAMPGEALALSAGPDSCSSAECLLSARIITAGAITTDTTWKDLNLTHEGPAFFGKMAWVFARLPQWSALQEWQPVAMKSLHDCETCCPPSPPIHWVKKERKHRDKDGNVKVTITHVPVEDGREAAAYEQSRPAPILVQTRRGDNSCDFRIGLSVASLSHKALGNLPATMLRSFKRSGPTIEWRLTPAAGSAIDFGRAPVARKYTLSSNKKDSKSVQPPHFSKQKLRSEQLRSLTWMIAQEVAPTPWVEQEVVEAVLPQLEWHAEVRAKCTVEILGGVIADEVGYGKTAITIGLISSQLAATVVPDLPDRIGVKATLVVVPGHLLEQWEAEISKFAGKAFKVIKIAKYTDLKSKTIAQIMAADIILVADVVLNSETYWTDFGHFSGITLRFDKKAGRHFRSEVNKITANLAGQIQRLRDPARGPKSTLEYIRKAPQKVKEELANVKLGKRKKGAAYADSKKVVSGTPPSSDEDEELITQDPAEDRWNLASCKDGWTSMKNPALAMFAFNRLVIDEFTYYIDPNAASNLVALLAIQAERRWILSGTPPLKDFGEIKTISTLLHVHLGLEDVEEGGSKKSKNDATDAERFHSYRDVKTASWHSERDDVAQRFLDHFVRQNVAEIDEIPFSDRIVPIKLPGAEMAIYSELFHHLSTFDESLLLNSYDQVMPVLTLLRRPPSRKIARVSQKHRGDRELRLFEALGGSTSPSEALLKRASHFADEASESDFSRSPCDRILKKRDAQRAECVEELMELVRTASAMHAWLIKHAYYSAPVGGKGAAKVEDKRERRFEEWLSEVERQTIGDTDTAAQLREVCTRAGCDGGEFPEWTEDLQKIIDNDESLKKFTTLDDGTPAVVLEHRKARVWQLRERVDRIRALAKELLGRTRSQRCFRSIRDAQLGTLPDVENVAILTSCGHHGPVDAVRASVSSSAPKCIHAPACAAPASVNNVILATSVCGDAESGTFGAKLKTLVNIVSSIPDTDRVLVFVQLPDLLEKVDLALRSYGIPVEVLKSEGAASQNSSTITAFQNSTGTDHKVLLLLATDKSASGTNLTIASHAIFVSPLLTTSTDSYIAFETQAIGRIRRYGQKKTAKVYRLVSLYTIDQTILEERTGKSVKDMIAAQLAADPTSTTFPRCTKAVDLAAARKKVAKATVKVEPESGAEDSDDDVQEDRGTYTDSSGDEGAQGFDEDEAAPARPTAKSSGKKAVPNAKDSPAVKKAAPPKKRPAVKESHEEAAPAKKKKDQAAAQAIVLSSDESDAAFAKPKSKSKTDASKPKASTSAVAAPASKSKVAPQKPSSVPASSSASDVAKSSFANFFSKSGAAKRASTSAEASPVKRTKTTEASAPAKVVDAVPAGANATSSSSGTTGEPSGSA